MSYSQVFHSIYFVIVAAGFLLSAGIKMITSGMNHKILKKVETIDWNGYDALMQMLSFYGIQDVAVEKQEGMFGDRFVPGARTIQMGEVSYSSPSLIGIAAALHQGCHAVQNDRMHIVIIFKYLLGFACRFAALLAAAAMPVMLFFPRALYAGLGAYSYNIILSIGLAVTELEGIRYASGFVRSSGRLDTAQIAEVKRILSVQSVSGIAAVFTPADMMINILTDGIKNLKRRLWK